MARQRLKNKREIERKRKKQKKKKKNGREPTAALNTLCPPVCIIAADPSWTPQSAHNPLFCIVV